MENLKYKQISKIIGINEDVLLRVSLEIQTNHIKMKTFKIQPIKIDDFVKSINEIDFFSKLSFIKKEYSYTVNGSEDSLREIYLTYIKDRYALFKKDAEFRETQEDFSNLDIYSGKSMPIVKWLSTFSNEILDSSIMEFVPSIVSKIESIPLNIIQNIKKEEEHSNINEFVVYMGNKRKYRGHIGYIEKVRDGEDASTLVCFPTRKKDKKSSGKLWCSNENLLVII